MIGIFLNNEYVIIIFFTKSGKTGTGMSRMKKEDERT